jgi:hypothetical protein
MSNLPLFLLAAAFVVAGCVDNSNRAPMTAELRQANLRCAAAMLAPTTTGSFGEGLGNCAAASANPDWHPPQASNAVFQPQPEQPAVLHQSYFINGHTVFCTTITASNYTTCN